MGHLKQWECGDAADPAGGLSVRCFFLGVSLIAESAAASSGGAASDAWALAEKNLMLTKLPYVSRKNQLLLDNEATDRFRTVLPHSTVKWFDFCHLLQFHGKPVCF